MKTRLKFCCLLACVLCFMLIFASCGDKPSEESKPDVSENTSEVSETISEASETASEASETASETSETTSETSETTSEPVSEKSEDESSKQEASQSETTEEIVYTSKNPVNFYGTFTNFDSATELTRSITTPAYGGQISGDIFAGEWANGVSSEKARFELAEGKGYNGSACLGLWSLDEENRAIYIFATEENGNSTVFPDISYLRVWVDFSDVAFRKANFGLISEQGTLFDTDEEQNRDDQYFWYLPEGSTSWRKYTHGDDGCFGDVQGSNVEGFKGWMAFPISDFTYRLGTGSVDEGDKKSYYSNHVAGVYMFWDYSDISDYCKSNKFYLDEIAIVADYTVFDEYPS